jgi:hypothetical protein
MTCTDKMRCWKTRHGIVMLRTKMQLSLPHMVCTNLFVESSWNAMAHGDAWDRKWSGKWQMELAASTLHTTSEHGVSSITTTDAQAAAASSQLNWHPHQFKWTCPFRRKMKSGFCTCAITFQTQSNRNYSTFCVLMILYWVLKILQNLSMLGTGNKLIKFWL